MRTVVRPSGRLPARVYWFRRLMVLFTALALVFAVGRMLNGSGSSTPPGDRAAETAGSVTPTASTSSQGPAGPLPIQPSGTGRPGHVTGTGAPVVLAAPSGPCSADEITVTPTVPSAMAGRPVQLVLELTGIRPACTFAVSRNTLVAKVTSGPDRIWSSQDCPASIRPATVVVRSAVPTKVAVSWSGRRSDTGCSRALAWALPGYYHLVAAVIGSDPGDCQFRLQLAPRTVITKTARPKTRTGSGGKGTQYGGDNAAPSG